MEEKCFAFLPVNERGWLLNLFHQAYRKGNHQPPQIINHVQASVTKYLYHPNLPSDKAKVLTAFLEALATPEALAHAQNVISDEQLPQAERDQLRAVKNLHHKQEFLAKQQQTTKQLNYIKLLGYQGQLPINKLEASNLINKLLKEKGQPT